MFWVLLIVLGVLAFLFVRTIRELSQLKAHYKPIIDVEKERDRVAAERDELTSEVARQRNVWSIEFTETVAELRQLTEELVSTRDQVAMESFGLYEPEFDFDDPEDYKTELKATQERQRAMVRTKTAAVCSVAWTVGDSAAKGRTMINRQLRLMLRAFNGECDAAVSKIRYSNITMLMKRIDRAHSAINKLGASQSCEIVDAYLELKLRELRIVHELREKQQEIREEQKAIREQMREEERARREIEKARAGAEKEELRYGEALARAREEVAAASGAAQEKVEAKIAELERRLREAHDAKERAKSRAQLTKSGHVYIVSNVGSFGESTYKIGMTRRLDPVDRVKELSDASVPFPFDVHAMIYSKNAPALEAELHSEFWERRLNKANDRKEFFGVELDEIATAVERRKPDDVEVTFTRTAAAEEYRRTLAILAAEQQRDEPSQVDKVRESLEERMKAWRTAR